MRVVRAPVVSEETIEEFYRLYRDAFEPLRTLAAARHVLTEEEFTEEMLDPRMDKYLAVDDAGVVVGLTTFTDDLSAIPWIEPAYYAARHPEHAARGAVFYLGFTLTREEDRGGRAFHGVLTEILARVLDERGVVAFDVCAHNEAVRFISAGVERVFSRRADVALETLDTQTYFSVEVRGPVTSPA